METANPYTAESPEISGQQPDTMPDSEGNPANSRFFWSSLSWSGQRKERNDDSCLAFCASVKGARRLEEIGEATLERDDLFFGVSDGMGGGQAGNVASSLLLEELTRHMPEIFHMAAQGFRPDYIEELQQIARVVHQGIHACGEASPKLHGMSATCTLAWFTPDNLYLLHVGDSRCYILRPGEELRQLSQDHTFAWKQWKRGQISEFEYRKHPRRSALYEVMGGSGGLLTPFITAFSWQPGDRFLLCSDGIVDGLWERHIGEYLARKDGSREEILAEMLAHAKENDPRDDKTMILIDIA